jgi:putative inorganic carbon (HCO3(-)) transporter
MFVMIIVALMAIKDYIDIGEVSRLEKARVGSIAEQPNMLAAFFVYYMFLFAGFMLVYWNNFRYWFLFFPFLACFRGIQVTFSRGGYVAFIAAALVIAFFRSKILFAFIAFILIFALLNPQFLPKGIHYRMASTFKDKQVFAQSVEEIVDKSSQRRIEACKGGIKMVKEHLLFGVGYGLFPYLIPRYAPVRHMDAHNTYILIAAEMGIPALLAFLLVLFIILKNTRKLYIKTNDKFLKALALGFLGSIGGVFVANIFGGRLDTQEVSSYFWILAALIFKALYFERQSSSKRGKYVSKSEA